MSVSPGSSLRLIRERRPLVHQITNYVVMNETANATLALGALPVMAHALEEVEEMAAIASALVLNIGTLSAPWIESMILAGKAANAAGVPVVFDPVGAGATRFRTETAERILSTVDITVMRANAGETATLAGHEAEVRGVDSISVGSPPEEIALRAASLYGCIASVTGPIDYVSDGREVHAVKNGHPLMALVTGTGCMATAMTACFVAVKLDDPLAAAAEALAAFGVAAEDAALLSRGPGTFHTALYDGLYNLDPDTLDGRARIS
jgi:hydroxyethylthiazole kinase